MLRALGPLAASALTLSLSLPALADVPLEPLALSLPPLLACGAGNEEAEAAEKAAELACNPIGKLPYFGQWQWPWGSLPLGDLPLCEGDDAKAQAAEKDATCCMPYSASGCGPTSLAMILRAYGERATPRTVGDAAVDAGLRRCNVDGISPAAIISTGKFRGYVVDESLDPPTLPPPREGPLAEARMARLELLLRSGRPVVLGCSGCTVKNDKGVSRTFGGHYMVLSGVNDDGSFAVLDPSGFDARSIERSEVQTRARLQYIRRTDLAPVVACRR